MDSRKQHWHFGAIYINPEDTRLFIPWKLGLAINFGHPQVVTTLFYLWIGIIACLILIPLAANLSYFQESTVPLFWVLLAILLALFLIRFNRCFSWSDYRFFPFASFGLLAIGVGFGIQSLINGPLVVIWELENFTWKHHLLLAPVAAFSQTFGKIVGIWLLFKTTSKITSSHLVRGGLLVGLGFTVLEICLIYFRFAWAQIPIESFFGVWERSSASMFHIYSAGLIAFAFSTRRYFVVVVIVILHSVMDFLAGSHESLPLTLFSLQVIFSINAACIWALFLFATRNLTLRPS